MDTFFLSPALPEYSDELHQALNLLGDDPSSKPNTLDLEWSSLEKEMSSNFDMHNLEKKKETILYVPSPGPTQEPERHVSNASSYTSGVFFYIDIHYRTGVMLISFPKIHL